MDFKHCVTITDIARSLNVSSVTVSKALRDHSDISRETKRLVLDVARRMGYTPNFAARNLSSRKSMTIGLVVPKVAHFFFSSVIEAVYDTAFSNNYDIALTVSQENPDREKRNIETLLAMGADGLIVSVSQGTRDDAVFRKVVKRDVPLVFMDRVLDIEGASQVTVNDRGGAFKAVETAIDNGYTKIAHIGGHREINIGLNRFIGYRDAMNHHGLPVNQDWVVFGGFGESDGYAGAKRILDSGMRPEFIFAVTYPVALGASSAIEEAGLRIPDDIDMICFGSSGISRMIKPEMSFVNQPTSLIGMRSVELVLEHLNENGDYTPKNIEIPTELVIRDTCIRKWNAVDRPGGGTETDLKRNIIIPGSEC